MSDTVTVDKLQVLKVSENSNVSIADVKDKFNVKPQTDTSGTTFEWKIDDNGYLTK